MSKVLVDSDLIVYRIACALDNTRHKYRGEIFETKTEIKRVYGEGYAPDAVETFREPESEAMLHKQLDRAVEDIVDASWCEDYQLHLSGKGNHRFKVQPTLLKYKENRSSSQRPYHYDNARQYLVEQGAILSVGMEANDALGLAQTEDTTIASLDKDMMVVPGKHFNWVKDKEVYISVVDADRNYFCQQIFGDSADNIKGLSGIGPKSTYVKKVMAMENSEEMEDLVRSLYTKFYGDWGDRFYESNAQLLWILQTRKCPVSIGSSGCENP